MPQIDDIRIPGHFVQFAAEWYDGQADILYAIASTGNLETGNRRPYDEDGLPMTDAAWGAYLLSDLTGQLAHLLRTVPQTHPDYYTLLDFSRWAEATEAAYLTAHGLD